MRNRKKYFLFSGFEDLFWAEGYDGVGEVASVRIFLMIFVWKFHAFGTGPFGAAQPSQNRFIDQALQADKPDHTTRFVWHADIFLEGFNFSIRLQCVPFTQVCVRKSEKIGINKNQMIMRINYRWKRGKKNCI